MPPRKSAWAPTLGRAAGLPHEGRQRRAPVVALVWPRALDTSRSAAPLVAEARARGAFAVRLDLGADFAREVGTGGEGLAALAAGGLLVGIGASVSGGCSTGHGLSGCSRLQPAGVAATATFFATAVACSFLLDGVRP